MPEDVFCRIIFCDKWGKGTYMNMENLRKIDAEVANNIDLELERQRTTIELIASENFTSKAVMAACGTVLTNKYAEGKPHKRFYNGCENVDIIEELAQKLTDSGRMPLLWNVDGLWYLGDEYHGDGEGSELGQWENDHVNCRFRAKTRGAYEYIENGVYTPVIRGVPNDIKKNWSWGDIFEKHETWQYGFDEAKGVYRLETIKI